METPNTPATFRTDIVLPVEVSRWQKFKQFITDAIVSIITYMTDVPVVSTKKFVITNVNDAMVKTINSVADMIEYHISSYDEEEAEKLARFQKILDEYYSDD